MKDVIADIIQRCTFDIRLARSAERRLVDPRIIGLRSCCRVQLLMDTIFRMLSGHRHAPVKCHGTSSQENEFMRVSMKRLGQRFHIAESLEITVLELTRSHVKFGIRSLDESPESTPQIACSPLRCRSAYYYSRRGTVMLVVSSYVGQRIRINESVDLCVDRLDHGSVGLFTRHSLNDPNMTRAHAK